MRRDGGISAAAAVLAVAAMRAETRTRSDEGDFS